MALQSITQLKQWFRTALKPTQQQFWDWLDSYRHKSEAITIDDLSEPLQAAINSIGSTNEVLLPPGTTSFTLLAGTLVEKILFLDATNPAVSVGESEGGTQVYDEWQMIGGIAILAGDYYTPVLRNIYFNGVTESTIIKIYKR